MVVIEVQSSLVKALTNWCHDLPKRTYENTETDFYGYRNGPERTSVGTETDRNRLQLRPKQTSGMDTNFFGLGALTAIQVILTLW